MWSARVHKTGSKIQLLKNGNVSKTIEAGDETFAPYEAQKFAEDLVGKMNDKVAKQMTDPGAQPSVATEGETQNESLKAVNQQATGKAVKDAASSEIAKTAYEEKLETENKSLKKKIAKVEKEAHIERKARRGVAIAKALVEQKKLANDEDAIKDTVMKITAMSNDEINLLERKANNKPLYDSVEDAEKASRRYARMARLHRQAAEDAQIGGDEKIADDEDVKAARYDDLSKEAFNAAGEYAEAGYNNTADTGTSEDIANQIKDDATGVGVDGKKASDEMKPEIDDIMFQAEDGDDDDEILEDDVAIEEEFDEDDDEELPEEEQFEEEDEEEMNMEAAAKIYRKIAADHTAKAEEHKTAGDEKKAEVETEIAKEATELAEGVEAKIASTKTESDEDMKKAASIYRQIAENHKKKAEALELDGKTAEADVEDEISVEASKMAEDVEAFMKKETEDEIIEDDSEEDVEEVTEDVEAAVEDTGDELETTDEIEVESAEEDTIDDDAILENAAMEGVINVDEVDELPSDEEIAAALDSGDEELDAIVEDDAALEEVASEEEETDEAIDKEADNKQTRKVAEIEKSASSDVDREEANRYSNQVDDLEGLWK